MKNAGKACNNRLYRHIRTFEKIVKNYFVIWKKTVSAELTADLHRVKVRDAVSSVNENHALWKRRSGCYEEKQRKGSKIQ